MPATSGASHGLAAFVSLIIGAILSKYVWQLLPPVGEVALFVMVTVRSLLGVDVPIDEQLAGTAVVMVLLSFLWGVVYHVGRHS